MLSSKIKDLKYRLLYAKIEQKNLINKFLFVNLLNKKTKLKKLKKKKMLFLYAFLKSKTYKKLKSKTKTKIVRRCSISNRSRGNYRPFGISRFFLRNFMQFGLLPGYKKAVW